MLGECGRLRHAEHAEDLGRGPRRRRRGRPARAGRRGPAAAPRSGEDRRHDHADEKVASSPVLAIVGAGAALANPGAFIPIALKDISELNPSATQYVVDWLFFSLASLLPLATALVLLLVARGLDDAACSVRVRIWLERNARTIAAVLVVLLALSLLRNGIAGLTA